MRGSLSKWFPPPVAALSAVSSGLLLAAAFPPLSIGPLSVVALVPLFVALQRAEDAPRMFFKTGYVFGVVFFAAHLWWVVRLSPASSITVPWLMAPAITVLVLYLALYPALWLWLVGWIGRGRTFSIVFLGPSLWVLVEWVRSTGAMGFPWGSIGYSAVRHPSMMQSAALFGVLGLGAVIVLVNARWSSAIVARRQTAKALFLAAGLVIFLSNVVGGRAAIARFDAVEASERSTVALAQPNVDLAMKWEPEFTDSMFLLIAKQTKSAAALGPDLVVFPETAAPVYLCHDTRYKAIVHDLAYSFGTAVFIGFLDGRYDGPGSTLNVYNSSGLFLPDGRYEQYDKVHLLPFGETIPFGWRFRFLQRIDFGQANFQPGPDRPALSSPVGNLAPLICFESTFPDRPRKAVARGADLLVNITNDGWFGNTPGPHQHSDMAILRAVENRRFLVRSANTGVTMIVDPVGRITRKLAMDEEAILSGEVYRVQGTTVYTRYGDRPLLAAAVLGVLLGIVTGPRGVRGRFRRGK
jgi:apolipoprotein N-acyltransferase